jgi:UDP-glucose 4-epimerase
MAVTPASGTVAVTGATGFAGSALLPALLGAGYAVRALVREVPAAAHPAVDWIAVGDLAARLRDALRGVSTLVHLAAQAHRPVEDSAGARAALTAINVEASATLAQAAAEARVGHFVFASSVKVHGEASRPGRPWRESDPLAPADAYGASKAAAEAALAQVAARTGLRVTALRLPLVYGPGARANFAALVRAVQRGVPLPLAAVANRRSLLATGNLASATLALLASRGDEARLSPYFVADAKAVSTAELVRALARALAVAPRLVPVKGESCGPVRYLPVKGSTKIYSGATVMLDASGYANPAAAASGNNAFVVAGIAEETVDNSAGSDGDLSIRVKANDDDSAFGFNNHGSDTCVAADIGKLVYATDDNVVANAQSSTNRPLVGYIHSIDDDGLVYVTVPGRKLS